MNFIDKKFNEIISLNLLKLFARMLKRWEIHVFTNLPNFRMRNTCVEKRKRFPARSVFQFAQLRVATDLYPCLPIANTVDITVRSKNQWA